MRIDSEQRREAIAHYRIARRLRCTAAVLLGVVACAATYEIAGMSDLLTFESAIRRLDEPDANKSGAALRIIELQRRALAAMVAAYDAAKDEKTRRDMRNALSTLGDDARKAREETNR